MKRARFDRIAMKTLLFELDNMQKKHFSIKDMRVIFGKSNQTIYRWINLGYLHPGKINGRHAFHKDDIIQFIHANSEDTIY